MCGWVYACVGEREKERVCGCVCVCGGGGTVCVRVCMYMCV